MIFESFHRIQNVLRRAFGVNGRLLANARPVADRTQTLLEQEYALKNAATVPASELKALFHFSFFHYRGVAEDIGPCDHALCAFLENTCNPPYMKSLNCILGI